jgi:hypothetical protein
VSSEVVIDGQKEPALDVVRLSFEVEASAGYMLLSTQRTVLEHVPRAKVPCLV